MKELVSNFSNQIREAISIAQKASLSPATSELHNILITGLGGSGIGGTITADLIAPEATLPVTINKTYTIPAFVNKHTLVIVSSYSGNTEETIAAAEAAFETGAKIICVSSGGAIIDFAKKNGLDHIIIPGGMPPRACVGYSLTQVLHICKYFGIIKTDVLNELNLSASLIDSDKNNIEQEAMRVAKVLHGKLPVIYTLSSEGVAVRFRQQINENAKELCWHHVVPEMNHNELVGWRTKNEHLAVVILENENDFYRNKKRMEVCLQIIEQYTSNIVHICSKGPSDIQRAIYHIHLTDWVSCYIADLKNIDPNEVNVITRLKNELSKI
jgi:glucose/mannose-6-phosphate isomerase